MKGTTAYDGACACGGLIEVNPKMTVFASNLPLVYENGQWPMKTLDYEGQTYQYVSTRSCKVTGIVHSYSYTSPTGELTLLAW